MSRVIRFSGDSGDGMQLIGNLFSESVAFFGYNTFTFPDYPAEVRAPQGTVAGVSGFQVNFSKSKVLHEGDSCDILVAMNPAALIAHHKHTTQDTTILIDRDNFTDKNIEKTGYSIDSFIENRNIVDIPITQMTFDALEGVDRKVALKCRNVTVLGIVLAMYDIPTEYAEKFLEKKFMKKSPEVYEANMKALEAGVNYVRNTHLQFSTEEYTDSKIEPGQYRSINGNQAVAWGFIAAAEKAGIPLFCGSYPITPATGILEELAKHKALGVKTVQAEDEIAGICTAIGAAFGGSLAVTTTSGPGLALKSEALGLAVMAQIPLVVVDVQRGGPSTGLPTKSEQADLLQAMYGRNGDCPVVVLAAHSPADCFDKAYTAAKIALERMMPVILLTDGNLANGTEPWKIKKVEELDPINPPFANKEELERHEEAFNERGQFNPYFHNVDYARYWAIPGMEGLEHRIGGLEKEPVTGAISYKPIDHRDMGHLRRLRVNVTNTYLPIIDIKNPEGDAIVLAWGSNAGKVQEAVENLNNKNYKLAYATVDLINPLQCGLIQLLGQYRIVIVCESNDAQFAKVLSEKLTGLDIRSITNTGARPFEVQELEKKIKREYNENICSKRF